MFLLYIGFQPGDPRGEGRRLGPARNKKGHEEGDVNINYHFEGYMVHKKENRQMLFSGSQQSKFPISTMLRNSLCAAGRAARNADNSTAGGREYTATGMGRKGSGEWCAVGG